MCVSVEICNLPEPTPAAAEGCQAGGAPERGGGGGVGFFCHQRFRSAPKREGRVDPLDLSRLSGLNPQVAGLDCSSSQEMSLVVAP